MPNTAKVEKHEHETALYVNGKPTSETGMWMHRHAHEWIEIGAERWPVGTWHPLFRCLICTDVICDIHVEVPEPARAPSTLNEGTPT